MEYYEAANALFELRQFRPKPGTASTRDVLAYLGDPHEGVEYVQVAGSNGKGSTARMTEAILREHGLTVGLYTSPHFDDVRERFRVNNRMIPKAAVTRFVELVGDYLTERAATGDPVTFFEATTAMGLWYFGREDVDVAVLEVGIGGQYDATCVVEPIASAVTSVSLEHTEILGDTIEEIARDKTHVAPRENPLVTGATGEALDAVIERCHELHEERGTDLDPANRVCTVGGAEADVHAQYLGRTNHAEARVTLTGADWSVDTRIPLLGRYQAHNAGMAASLARHVRPITTDEIARGLRAAAWPGRFEIMRTDPLVVLDGAHNPAASTALAAMVDEFDYRDLVLVFGAMHEKEHREMAAALSTADRVITCRPMRDRAADPVALANVFDNIGTPDTQTIRPVEAAVTRAIAEADDDDLVLVTGSLFTVAEARQRWARTNIPKRIMGTDDAETALRASSVNFDLAPTAVRGGVHRVIKTRLHQRQARWVEEEFRARGGTCARMGLAETIEEPVDVILMGTRAEFDALFEAMREAPDGLDILASDLAATVSDTADHHESFPWDDGPAIMGILNVTPDSFHDGGQYEGTMDAIEQATSMIEAGATIIDIGGESTRPGADPVDPVTERERIIPVIEAIAETDVAISVDTRKSAVAQAALEAGADMLNDVSGLGDPEMRFVAAEYDVPLVVMHSIDTPVVPDRHVHYDDVVEDVIVELREKVLLAEAAGLDREQIIIDPGLGFGKSAAESFELLGRAEELAGLGCPVMIGHSHKSMFELIDRGPDDRAAGTVAGTAIATAGGVDIIRVHDVAANVAARDAVLAAQYRR